MFENPPGEGDLSSSKIPLDQKGDRGIEFQAVDIPLSPPSEEGGPSSPKSSFVKRGIFKAPDFFRNPLSSVG